MFKRLTYLAIFGLFLAMPAQMLGQIGGIGGPIPEDTLPCGPPFGPPCEIPLDGGVSLLIAAGIALGGKKVLDAKRK